MTECKVRCACIAVDETTWVVGVAFTQVEFYLCPNCLKPANYIELLLARGLAKSFVEAAHMSAEETKKALLT